MRFYTSDLHLGHVKIIELCNRPFKNITEMHNEIVSRWNNVVDPTDIVYILGDLALGKIAESLQVVPLLNGKKYLVPGNHDRCWIGNKRIRPQDVSCYTDVGINLLPENCVDPNGFRLSHFPFEGDSGTEERFPEFRPKRRRAGDWLLHGHVHNMWRVNDRQINVGVDVWNFTPISENVIRDIMHDLS